MNIRSLEVVFVLMVCCALFPQPVYAYIDPSTGSYVIQLVFGALFGLYLTLKVTWRNYCQRWSSLFLDLPRQLKSAANFDWNSSGWISMDGPGLAAPDKTADCLFESDWRAVSRELSREISQELSNVLKRSDSQQLMA